MNKRLEQRIARLEKAMCRKNEQLEDAAEAVYNTARQIDNLCRALEETIKSTDAQREIADALSMCEFNFPRIWRERLIRINNNR